jgi:hypothetical protein
VPDPPAPVKPDYGGAWIGAVLPALRSTAPPAWLPAPAAWAQRVVLLVVDGLGWQLHEAQRARTPCLASMEGGPITATVPSTTAAGLPSITTGLTPAEHGLLGFRIGLDQGVLNVLRWRFDGGGRGPDAAALQPVPAFGGRALPTVVRAEFEGSGFTGAHLGGADLRGWQTPAVLRTHVATALAAGARVVYAYYDGLDKVAHAHGLSGPAFEAEVADCDRLVGELLDLLPADAALVVTADHGHVAVGPDGVVATTAVERLVRRSAGEGRFRSLYARTGRAAELHRACTDVYGDRAWVFTRDELFDDGWVGGGGPAHHRRRLGDVVLAPFADVSFADAATPREDGMASRHGSLTEAEVLVPLLAATGRGA